MIFGAKVQVTNTSDDVTEVGSLRWACENATASDTIVFNFATKGDKVIHVNERLSTKACVDGSTWADSIIIDGYDEKTKSRVDYGFVGLGSFVKKIAVQNFGTGFSLYSKVEIIDCIARNCTSNGFYCFANVIFNHCQSINNYNGIYFYSGYKGSIEDCYISGNKMLGIYGVSDVSNCRIYDNQIGIQVYSSEICSKIENCVISGNDSIGVVTDVYIGKFSGNIVGLTADQKKAYANGIGIKCNRSGITDFNDNVVSGNKTDGIVDVSRASISTFKGNYIGTNRFFDDNPALGNGGHGFVPSNEGSYNVFSDNYFGNNGGYAIFYQGCNYRVDLDDLYVGITPDGKPMPNALGGINWGTITLNINNCHIGYNGGTGVISQRDGGYLNVNGGSICYNKGNGIETSSNSNYLNVKNVVFDSNEKNAVSVDIKKAFVTYLSENKFLRTAQSYSAFATTDPYPYPQISSCVITQNSIELEGSIDTATIAKIELFFTSQGNQTAETLVDSVYTDKNGNFSFSLSRENAIYKDAAIPAFVATAIYNGKITSELSSVAYPKPSEVDLTRAKFYVKRNGIGDGSTWEKAMSPQTFASVLPKVADGTTFFVAEGTYYPMYDREMNLVTGKAATFVVNSDVSIKGGYPASAKTGAVSDPSQYKTVFSGDFAGDDDAVVEIGSDDLSRIVLKNTSENSDELFLVKPSVSYYAYPGSIVLDKTDMKNYFRLDGVVLRGSRSLLMGAGNNLEFYLTNSEFEYGDQIYMIKETPSLYVNHCKFHHMHGFMEFINPKHIEVRNSTFEESNTYFFVNAYTAENFYPSVLFDSVTFDHIYYTSNSTMEFQKSNVVITNSKFIDCNRPFQNFISAYGSSIEMANCDFENIVSGDLCYTSGDFTKFYNNTFNKVDATYLLNKYGGAAYVDNCLFDANKGAYSLLLAGDSEVQDTVINCSFIDNENNYLISFHGAPLAFVDNTVVGNQVKYSGLYGSDLDFYNNTVIGNSFSNQIIEIQKNSRKEVTRCNLGGNIVLGNGTQKNGAGYNNLPVINCDEMSARHNLMPIIRTDYQDEDETADNTTWSPDNSTNIFVRPFDLGAAESVWCKACASAYPAFEEQVLGELFDGTYNKTTHQFKPVLDMSGKLPVVRLKTPRLSDGTSLLFPIDETIVTSDQLGEKRFSYTSMGSIEKECLSDTVFAYDTIIVGTSFHDSIYTELGRHENIYVTLTRSDECDSVVNYTLYVTPDTTSLAYYVKKQREGKGDGRRWEDAMSEVDFANSLPFAPKGATYYVAQGTYKPLFAENLSATDNSPSRVYTINDDVVIKGGYPDTAKTGDQSDPDKFPTIFSGDINGDDVVLDDSLHMKFTEDNVNYLFNVLNKNKIVNLVLDSVSIQNAGYLIQSSWNNTTLNLSMTKSSLGFGFNYGLYSSKVGTLNLNHCDIHEVNKNVIHINADKVILKNTVFQKNFAYELVYDGNSNLHEIVLDSVRFDSNIVSSSLIKTYVSCDLTNSLFIDNVGPEFLLHIYQNLEDDRPLQIRNCVFDNNDVENVVSYYGPKVRLDQVRFLNNKLGGYIVNSRSTDVQLTNSLFDKNVSLGSTLENRVLEPNCNYFSCRDLVGRHNIYTNNMIGGEIYITSGSLDLIADTLENNEFMSYFSGCTEGFVVDSSLIKHNVGQLCYLYLASQKTPAVFSIKNSNIIDHKGGFAGGRDSFLVYIKGPSMGTDSLSLYRTNFVNCVYPLDMVRLYNTRLNVQESLYENDMSNNITGYSLFNISNGNTTFSNNSFYGNKGTSLLSANKESVLFENNSLLANDVYSLIFASSLNSERLYNNSIVGNITKGDLITETENDFRLFGNIIWGNVCDTIEFSSIEGVQYNMFQQSDGNLLSSSLSETNVFGDLTNAYDGAWDINTGVFIPSMRNMGGYTPVAPLRKDKTEKGVSIKFPLSQTIVTSDQRGVNRFDMTCMGAYEITCSSDTFAVDTVIYEGESFQEIAYHIVGQRDTVFERLTASNGCDSLVQYNLIVKQSPLIVTNENNEGEGSLRNAVEYANKLNAEEPVEIIFRFDEPGRKVIKLDTTITILRGNITINGASTPEKVVIEAKDQTYSGLYVPTCNKSNIFITDLTFKNFMQAVDLHAVDSAVVKDCVFDGNYYGISNYVSNVTVINSNFVRNKVGYYTAHNHYYGCSSKHKTIIKGSVFGLDMDQTAAEPNEVGIEISGSSGGNSSDHYIDISQNVISGNDSHGIYINSSFIGNDKNRIIHSNLIGTNKYNEHFGNGGDGINVTVSASSLYIGSFSLDSANVIAFNRKNGISCGNWNSINILNNYIGLSKDFEPLPNEGCGVYSVNTIYNFEGNYIGFNGEDGVRSEGSATLSNNFIGGDGVHDFGNGGYGVNCCRTKLFRNNIWNNHKGGVNKDCETTKYPVEFIYASQNLFGGSAQKSAISDVDKKINIPQIDEVRANKDSIFIIGKVALLDRENMEVSLPRYIDTSSVTIELFANAGEPETAHKYVDVIETDSLGNYQFKFALNDPKVAGSLSFVTTATFRFIEDYGIGTNYYTSGLSQTYTYDVSDTVMAYDTICAAIDYNENGWNISADELSESGDYRFERIGQPIMGGNALEVLYLHVLPLRKAEISYLDVQSPECAAEPFGSLQFSAEAKNNALWTVSVKNESGDVLAAQPFINSTNNNTTRGSSIAKRFVVKFLTAYFPPIGRLDSLKPGYYDIVLHSTATCTADTTYRVNVEAFSEPVIMGQTDTTLVTLCRNESQAKYTTTIEGFKPSMKVFLDDKDVNLTGNMSLSVSSAEKKAQVSLEAIPAGDHQLTAVDSCGKAYLLSNIHVLAPDTISLVVSDHAKMPLKCSYDKLPYMELVVSGGVEPKVSVESDYIHTNFLRHDTIRIENYPVGDYTFIARTNVDNCTDEKSLDFRVEGPDSLSIDLQTNAYGKFCEEGGYDLEAVTSGESGNYTFTWSCPTGEEKVTTSNILKNVGPGFYTCVVKDNEGCSQALDTALLSLDVELSKIKINGIKQSATCFSAPYAKISVNYSNNNAKQVVTCLLNDKNTGELVKSATSKLQNGALVLTEVPVGTYDLSVRYGTPDCVLDTTKYANETITVNPKSEPLSIGTPVIKPQSCVTKPNGMISVAVAGWDDYSSFMDNRRIRPDSIIASTAYFNVKNLGGGKHVFVVKDACDGKDSVVVDESQMPVLVPAVMSLSHLIDTVKCAREKSAQVAVNIQGGAPDQGLIVFDGVEYPYDRNSILFGGLGKGKHTIVYRSDDETCEHDVITKTIEVKGPDTLSVQFALTGIDCDAAKLLVVAKGETSPYLFIWDENGKTSNPSLLSVSPFAPKSDSVYGLTVKDAAGCDSMYTQFRVPNANELPQLLINPIGYPEKCYQGNNGSMDIWFSSGSNKLPFGMMVTIELTKDGKPFKTYERAIQDKESYLIQLVDCLEPGDYEVSARYGSKECQMTTHQAVGKTHVEALHKLTIGSNVAVSPQTCTRANGEVSLDIDGWNDSHSVELYRVVKIHFPLIGSLSYNVRTAMTYEALKEGQLCHMRITGLKSASYFFKVSDVCGNSAKSNTFFVDYIPTTIENGSTERLTCLGKPNGVVNFEVHGWTPSHGCELVKDDQRLEVVSPALPYEIDQEKKIAYFRIDTVTAGNWRIWVSNECGESMMSDTLCTVKGINPYNINLDEKHSKLHLDCPYSEDGVVSLTVTGGIAPTEFFANRTMVVPKEQFAGYDTIVSVKFDTVMVEQLVYDSTNCVVAYDTTVSGAARDTVITSFLDCPIKIDPVTGDFVRELTPKVQRVIDTTYVERYATVNTTVYDSLPSDLFYSTEPITVGGIFTIGYKLVKRYKAEDQKVGTYEYTYKSAVEGCPDKAVKKVVIDRPYPVTLVSQTLDVSCTSATDGHISLKPIRRYTRLPEKPQFVVNHDTTGNYGVSDVYNFSSDSVQTASGKVPSNNHTRTKDANGNNLYDHIDRLDDVSDFTSITWSYKPFKGTAWNAISPVVPYRSDSTEQYYYDANGTLIKSPVYSSFHLDDFWIDYNGKFQHYDVQSIANLNPGYYAVEVQDKKNCVYHDTLPVNLPPNKLEIVDIQFDEEGAICDPKKRQIHVDVRGGWGNYMYSFTNVSKTDTSIGRLTSGFRGGEATYFNDKDTTGWGESHFLEPGDYMIHVIDEKGCIVSSERKYSVTTKFEMKADTLQVICPRDESIKNEVYFYNSTPAVATYNIYDLQSTCIPDEVDSCRNKSYKEMLFDKAPISRNGKSLFDLDLTVGTHGLFVYENVEGGCGTYLEATIIDTLIPLNMTLKRDSISKLISLCHDSKDATAEFFIMGGTPDYKIVRNPSWGSEEIMEIDGVPQVFTPELKTIHYDSKNALGQDTVIERKYITLDGLQSGTYYFSTIDALGCVRPFGGDSIDSVRVYKPDTLKVEFATSAICPDASITTGGNIFFNKAKGGTAPYTYSFQHGDGPLTECGTVQSIPMAKAIPTVYMAITDANGCKLDTTINFLNDKFVVDTIDFWASTWRHKGDILSLIDICTPVEYLDSVSYTFKKHSFDDVDTRIETLDKRMYIYDIENGQEKFKKALFAEGVDTKRDASDAYFKNHFNLLVDDTLAMHINFIQMNDTTGDWIMGSNLQDSVWVIHDVKMTAYFKGCAYETQYRELKVAFDTIPLYYGGLATRGEILDLNVGPNPCEKLSETYITVNFSASVEEAQLNVYHLDGGISGSYHIKKDVDDKHWKSATEYDDAEFKISLGELLDANFVDNSAGSLIIFVSTKNDRQSTHVLLSPSVTQ